MTGRNNEEIWSAAEKANQEFGQWMPQRWIECFIAALSAPVEAPVAVKPLEWRDVSYKGDEGCVASWGDYRINRDDACDWPYVLRPFITGQSNYQSLDAAQAAAQADYEQRIWSALTATTHPRPLPSVDDVALVADLIDTKIQKLMYSRHDSAKAGQQLYVKNIDDQIAAYQKARLTLLGGSAR